MKQSSIIEKTEKNCPLYKKSLVGLIPILLYYANLSKYEIINVITSTSYFIRKLSMIKRKIYF
jgi:hypothetical protein